MCVGDYDYKILRNTSNYLTNIADFKAVPSEFGILFPSRVTSNQEHLRLLAHRNALGVPVKKFKADWAWHIIF